MKKRLMVSGGWGVLTVLSGILLLAGCSGAGSTADIPAVTKLEVERYLGKWYEIARLPHRFERDLCNVTAEYKLDDSGKELVVINRGYLNGKLRRINGHARFRNSGKADGELEVSFFRPFYGSYRIIRLDPEYRLAVITSSTRDYLWFLARTPAVSEAELNDFIAYAAEKGFDVSKLEFPGSK